ncbi:MAG: hypothetical protein A4E62_01128 [Syntrophorhabdus sp. PtaU1.Bin002]|nr:MAG: hypothetical protein A4E62_01128 [Syntrophorhabdus sp. PtaU1.Bin002]
MVQNMRSQNTGDKSNSWPVLLSGVVQNPAKPDNPKEVDVHGKELSSEKNLTLTIFPV